MFGIFKESKKNNERYNIGDKLYYYYTYPNHAPYNGKTRIVSFFIENIYVETVIDKFGQTNKYRYEGGKFGCNYYGIAPENLVADTVDGLTAKLIMQGYAVSCGEKN